MSILKLKLGPAVKILGAIRSLRQALLAIPYNDLIADHSSVMATVLSCFPPLTTASSTQTPVSSAGTNGSFSITNLTVDESGPAASPSSSSAMGMVVMNGTRGCGSPSVVVGTATEKSSH